MRRTTVIGVLLVAALGGSSAGKKPAKGPRPAAKGAPAAPNGSHCTPDSAAIRTQIEGAKRTTDRAFLDALKRLKLKPFFPQGVLLTQGEVASLQPGQVLEREVEGHKRQLVYTYYEPRRGQEPAFAVTAQGELVLVERTPHFKSPDNERFGFDICGCTPQEQLDRIDLTGWLVPDQYHYKGKRVAVKYEAVNTRIHCS
jgi:hypothetical protein